ncbi:hypothetical protein [Paenarthrobacter ureafaciens]|uniref:hypothetical protein n=1 Tax=Paenarthrobacter ureafaciens TaxID=37931 RepID=UPI002DC045A3|nr:hypothetical protein [Paenarthrobacter ureafaciens]MEC3851248.1 hypothetical protein [Paenarthrobacter ureafaciens]
MSHEPQAAGNAAEQELRDTLGTAIGTAQEHLLQNGGFLPFGITLSNDGELRIVLVTPNEPDEDGHLDAEQMLADVQELLKQGRNDYRAVAVAYDASLPEHDCDGITGAAEHRDGTVLAAIVPYHVTDDGFTFEPMEPDTHEPSVWVD